ncbi:MAG TPA: RNA 2',3'-cyclic phosphodiesterase [Candidatus Acidoferrum sp.]|nr:RNA 2',3'-cyclic phosphodiesterase [Candidatus Acidoferrum sp.]
MTDPGPAATHRLFIAIALPPVVQEEIILVQRELQPLVPREVVRWTRPDQFHLTLRFLGNFPVHEVEGLKRAVGDICRNASPLGLQARGVGFFPHARSPRVVWVGVDDSERRLLGLQKQIETAVSPLSSEPGEKNFAGHVTLGRLKNPRPSDVRDLVVRVQALESRAFGNWMASEVEIIRSELCPAGARYTSLAACRLAASRSAR